VGNADPTAATAVHFVVEVVSMANDLNITHRDLWIALYSAVLAGSAATPALPGALAERAREVTDEAVQVIVSRWPDLPEDYQPIALRPRT
jgi:hypothetical protein